MGFTAGRASWMLLVQSGYDEINNTIGKLIKTFGFPGGLEQQTTFGTVSFKAKKAGMVTIVVTTETAFYDAGNVNTLAGLPGAVTVAIAEPVLVLGEEIDSGKDGLLARALDMVFSWYKLLVLLIIAGAGY